MCVDALPEFDRSYIEIQTEADLLNGSVSAQPVTSNGQHATADIYFDGLGCRPRCQGAVRTVPRCDCGGRGDEEQGAVGESEAEWGVPASSGW